MQRTVWGGALQDEMAGALAPAIRAIGASIGPDGRHSLYAVGNKVATAASGSDIARRICSDHFSTRLLKETLVEVERDLGDGTARVAVMMAAALAEARRGIAAGALPERIAPALRSLRLPLDAAFADHRREAKDLVAVALGSGLSPPLAERVAEASEAVGDVGFIDIVRSAERGVTLTFRNGFGFDARPANRTSVEALDRVFLIVANDMISDLHALVPVIEGFAKSNKSLLIVARGFQDQALALVERNSQAGVLKVAALVPTLVGQRASDILEDLALATGATLVAEHSGTRLETLKPTMLGRAERFRREGMLVTLSGVGGDRDRIETRLRHIEAEIAAHRYLPLDREVAGRRHARLSGKWAEIRLNAASEDDPAFQLARNAIAAIRSARKDGVIAGAGVGLTAIAASLGRERPSEMSAATALAMLDAALRAPGHWLQRNAGRPEGPRGDTVVDPAGLSRSLVDVALSLACQLAGIKGGVLRHEVTSPVKKGAA